MKEKIRVLLVDDHLVIREGLRTLLTTEDTIEIAGEAVDGLEAIEKVKEMAPDVVLTDVRMPRLDGIQAIRRIKETRLETVVVMLTVHDSGAYVIDAVYAGAGGFLLKDATRELLMNTIRIAADGGTLIKDSLLQKALTSVVDGVDGQGGKGAKGLPELTSREMEILNLVAGGRTNKEISGAVGVTEDTTKKHVQSIIAKLHAADRTHAAIIAARAGLLSDPLLPDANEPSHRRN